MVVNNKLTVFFSYEKRYYNHNSINQLMDNYFEELEKLIDHCINKKDVELTPSDFDSVNLSQSQLDSLFSQHLF